MIKPISMYTHSQPVTTTNQLKGTIIPSPMLKNSQMSQIDMSVNDLADKRAQKSSHQ